MMSSPMRLKVVFLKASIGRGALDLSDRYCHFTLLKIGFGSCDTKNIDVFASGYITEAYAI